GRARRGCPGRVASKSRTALQAVADGVVGACDRCSPACGAGVDQDRLPALPGRLQLDIRPARARRLRAERGGRLSRYALDVAPADRRKGARLVTPLASLLPYACLGLLAIGLFGFFETVPFGVPRQSLADRLRQLEPEYWAHLAQQEHSAALRPVRVGHSILRPVVDELGRQLQAVLGRFGLVGSSDLQQ